MKHLKIFIACLIWNFLFRLKVYCTSASIKIWKIDQKIIEKMNQIERVIS